MVGTATSKRCLTPLRGLKTEKNTANTNWTLFFIAASGLCSSASRHFFVSFFSFLFFGALPA